MHSFVAQVAALAAITAPLVSAQTFTSCNPTKKSCPNVAGLAEASYSVDLTNGVPKNWAMTSGELKTSDKGGLFQINDVNDGPTIASDFSIFFGSVEITMQAAPGQGLISTFVMESTDLDEIDLEIVGSQTGQVQSNYFGKGNTTTYDRGQFHPVNSPQTSFHTYKVDWKPDTTQWFIDGQLVRTLNFADAVGGKNYPQTPLNIRIGNWVAGQPKNSAGVIEWAGGLADMKQAPFNMYVTNINIVNYNPCGEYEYSDQSGDWQSIKCVSKGASPKPSHSKSATVVTTSTSTRQHTKTVTASSSAVSASSPSEYGHESGVPMPYGGQGGYTKSCDEASMVPSSSAPLGTAPATYPAPINSTIPPTAPPAPATPVSPVHTASPPPASELTYSTTISTSVTVPATPTTMPAGPAGGYGSGNATAVAPSGSVSPITSAPVGGTFTGAGSKQGVSIAMGIVAIAGLFMAM